MYMLISICEREIVTEQFDTLEEAQKQMISELKYEFDKYDDYKITWDEIENENSFECDCFGFGAGWAWSNLDDDYNCDWKIVEIK